MNNPMTAAKCIYLTDTPPSTRAKSLIEALWKAPVTDYPDLKSVYSDQLKEPLIIFTAEKLLFVQDGLNTYEAYPIEGLPFLLKRLAEEGRH